MEFKEVLQTYLDYLRNEKSYSINTIDSYKTDLKKFENFILTNNYLWNTISKQKIYSFLVFCNVGKSSMARIFSSLKMFYQFCYKRQILDTFLFKNLKAPKFSRKLPKPIQPIDMSILLENSILQDNNQNQKEHQKQSFIETRDKAFFELLYSTGMRVSEAMQLNVTDVTESTFSDDELTLKEEFSIVGKGGKARIVFLGKYARLSLKTYIQQENIPLEGALFLNFRKTRLTRRGANFILKKRLHNLQIKGHYSVHSFRHTFATDLLNEGGEIRYIQELLGHASISTTQSYTHVAIEKSRETYFKSHPHARRS